MTRSKLITVRIDPELKRETEKVFDELGLSMAQAITLFFKHVTKRQGLPFAAAIPNAETQQAVEDALNGENLNKVNSLDKLLDELDDKQHLPRQTDRLSDFLLASPLPGDDLAIERDNGTPRSFETDL